MLHDAIIINTIRFMIGSILIFITEFIRQTIHSWGYFGVAALMGLESAAIPLPSEIIMPLSGSLVPTGQFSLFGIALAGAIGSVIGSWVLYWLGEYGGRPLIEKYGKYILISRHDLDLADKFFTKYGAWSTFFGRMLPVVRTYISAPAGIAKMPFWKMTFSCLAGSFLWSYALGWIGVRLGENWQIIETYFRKFDIVIVIVIIIALTYWIKRHLKHRNIESSGLKV